MKKKAVKKKSIVTKKTAPKKKTASHNLQSKLKELYNQNKILQTEINKTKKKYEQLERESLKLTKALMEAGYISKNLTSQK